MTDADIEAIKARNAARTPGKWYYLHDDDAYAMNCYAVASTPDAGTDDPADAGKLIAGCLVQSDVRIATEDKLWEENAEFIAHAPEDVTELVAEVERLRGLMGSIYRDALLELPAVEEAIRQERRRVSVLMAEEGQRAFDESNGDDPRPCNHYHAGRAAGMRKAIELLVQGASAP